MTLDCRHRLRPSRTGLLQVCGGLLLTAALCAPVAAWQPTPSSHGAQVTGQAAAESHGTQEERAEGLLPFVARLINFAALVGILTYFLRKPIAGYLDSRKTDIQQDLVAAAELRREATAQLADIEQKLKSLPAELEALKTRGAEDLRAEQARISKAVAAERERLLDQTRKEIAMRLRIARRDLIEYAAELAVRVAEERVRRAITPEDHLRLMDRYTTQLENAQ